MTTYAVRSDPTSGAIPAGLATQLSRHSVSKLAAPGPNPDQLALILRAATTVPDHGQLTPWRLVVVQGDARGVFGDALAAAGAEAMGSGGGAKADKLRGKALLAPTLIVIVASPRDDAKVPAWEQIAAASCTGYAVALAAHALGLGAVWKTAPFLDGADVREVLALTPGEQLLGWVNIGTVARDEGPEHPRPAVEDVVQELDAATRRLVRYRRV